MPRLIFSFFVCSVSSLRMQDNETPIFQPEFSFPRYPHPRLFKPYLQALPPEPEQLWVWEMSM